MDDFGYQKDDKPSNFSDLTKRIFLASATLFSIACFIYITINAYYFVYQDKSGNIEVIKSPEGPIKVTEEQNSEEDQEGMKVDHSIYDDIFGSKKGVTEQIKPRIMKNPQPAIAPKAKEIDRRLIKDDEEKKESTTRNSAKNNEKIVIFSEKKNEKPTKDLLTKEIGSEKKIAEPITVKKSEKRAVRVQVAAMSSEDAAQENWNKLNRLYSDLFSGLKPFIEKVDLGKRGTFYRLQIGNFYNQIEAEEFCNKYVVQGQKSRADCIIVE